MKTTHEELAPAEWSFHKIPEEELHAAWEWEIGRTVTGKGEPWLTLPEEKRRKILDYCTDKPVQELDLYYWQEAEMREYNVSHHNHPEQIHAFKIHWNRGKRQIVEAFKKWIGAQKIPACKVETFYRRNKGGRPKFFSLLVDLAIYRADKLGYSRQEAIALMARLFASANVASKLDGKHWRKNCNRIKAEVQKRGDFSLAWLLS